MARRALQKAEEAGGEPRFGLILRGGFADGATGRFALIHRHRFQPDGTLDILIVGGEGFTVDAVWTEHIPEFEGAPPLFVADVTPQQE